MEEQEKSGLPAVPPPASFRLFKRLFLSLPRAIARTPLEWKAKEWIAFALFITSVILAAIEKDGIHTLFVGNKESPAEHIAEVGHHFGDGPTVAALTILFLATGILLKNRALSNGGMLLAVAGIWCGFITYIGQFVLAEMRPWEGGEFRLFALNGHGVSGHASSAAVLFWPIYSAFREKFSRPSRTVLAIILLGWAAMVAWSRMWDDKHYLWNVMLGMGLGFSIGYVTVREWKRL